MTSFSTRNESAAYDNGVARPLRVLTGPFHSALLIAPTLAISCGTTSSGDLSADSGAATTATTGTGGGDGDWLLARGDSSVGISGAGGEAVGIVPSEGGMSGTVTAGDADAAAILAARTNVVAAMRLANDYFMAKWPDPGADIVTDKTRPSHIWTRAVYYEGLMALYAVDPERRAKYAAYAVAWGESHGWGLNGGTTTRSADNQCAGQTYLDLYGLQADAARVRDIKADIDAVVASPQANDWTWIDAIQMAMPVYARLGVLYRASTYFDKMYAMYSDTKKVEGGKGLYNPADHLWWRDQDFDAPYAEPNGKSCYWSRGNGWVYAALARVLDILPPTDAHRSEYLADFEAMSRALVSVRRADGFWNVSLFDPTHFDGKELTGTALFTYGMAWGVRKGILAQDEYGLIVAQSWNAMVTDSLHPSGFLGWAQGSGIQPSDGQPLSYDKIPDFEDYGLGCFLLAGSEIAKLAP